MIDDNESSINGTATFVSGNRAKIELWNNVFNYITNDEADVDDNETMLIRIEYRSGGIRHLDGHIFQALTNLVSIDLSDNELTILDADLLKGLKHLKTVNFSLNSIDRVQPGLFNDELEQLESIDLSKNRLVKLPRDLSQNVKHVRYLKLSFNHISNLDVDSFENFTNLTRLYFNRNSIREIKQNTFEANSNLTTIHFNQNKINFLPMDLFKKCLNLTEIRFSWNKIEKLDSSIFRGLINLSTIDFSHNRITELSADIFLGLSNLQYVNFSFNRLSRLNPAVFDRLSTRLKIDFRHHHHPNHQPNNTYDEFFTTTNNTIRKDVFTEYLIMLALSRHEIELPVVSIESHLRETNRDIFDPKRFTLLDFFLLYKPTKMIMSILERLRTINIGNEFRISNEESIRSLCRHGNEKLVLELDRYFPAVLSFKRCFDWSFEANNESAAIGFVRLVWTRVKHDYVRRDKTKLNFHDIVCKYEFYLNECVKIGFDEEWWSFIRTVLDIYEEEKTEADINMGRFYLTLFEKIYVTRENDQQQQTIEIIDDRDENHQLLSQHGGDLVFKSFDLSQISNLPVDDHVLNLVYKSNREDLIFHSTTKEFVHLKWENLPKTLYKLYLVCYIGFMLLYLINFGIVKRSDMKETSTGLRYFLSFVALVFSVEEFFQKKLIDASYWNMIEVICFPLCLFTLFVDDLKWLKIILYAASIVTLFAVFILRLDKISLLNIGVYTTVFRRVVKRSFGLLPLLGLCLFGFLFAFRVSVKRGKSKEEEEVEVEDFYNGRFVYNMVRLLTMSLGEYETSRMGLEGGGEFDLATSIVNYITYVIYLFVLPILVINMFIGVSVDEVRTMVAAEERNVRVRIEFVLDVQKAFDRIARRLTRERFNRLIDRTLMVQVDEVVTRRHQHRHHRSKNKKVLKKGEKTNIEEDRIEEIRKEVENQKAQMSESLLRFEDLNPLKLAKTNEMILEQLNVTLKRLDRLESSIESIREKLDI